MPLRWTTILLLTVLSGCSLGADTQRFSVYFQPYSAELDQQGRTTIDAAANFAQAHPGAPVALTGYSAPPDPALDVEGLSAKRAEVVKQGLVGAGVGPGRISTAANGITDPKSLPTVAVRRVDISVGN